MNFTTALILFSGISLSLYGYSCLTSVKMKEEFKRYGLPGLRMLIGSLELLGGLGLLVGLKLPIIGLISAGGLSILLLGAVGVRVVVRDGILETTPAFLYFLLNLFLAYSFLSDIL